MGPGPWGELSLGRRLRICLGKYAAMFQAEIHAILACVYEIQMNDRQEKYINIYSDSQATLRALQAAKAISPLVQQCQKALNDSSTHHSVELFWVLGHSGICRNEIANGLTREGTVHQFAGLEPALGGGFHGTKKKR
jgi:ribonuclease HI